MKNDEKGLQAAQTTRRTSGGHHHHENLVGLLAETIPAHLRWQQSRCVNEEQTSTKTRNGPGLVKLTWVAWNVGWRNRERIVDVDVVRRKKKNKRKNKEYQVEKTSEVDGSQCTPCATHFASAAEPTCTQ